MKTRRIILQPSEPLEVLNSYGYSLVKILPAWYGAQPVAVLYEQPHVELLRASDADQAALSAEPKLT